MQYITGKIGKTWHDCELFLVDSQTRKKTPISNAVKSIKIKVKAGEVIEATVTMFVEDLEVEEAEVIGDEAFKQLKKIDIKDPLMSAFKIKPKKSKKK